MSSVRRRCFSNRKTDHVVRVASRLLRPLAGLMIEASRQSQVWVTTHSRELAQAVVAGGGARPIQLALVGGETIIETEEVEE